MSTQRESYYLMLGLNLDPPEMDESVIRVAIITKKNEWSSNHGIDPVSLANAKRKLGYSQNIEKEMLTPDGRQRELALALEQQQQKKAADFAELDSQLQTLQSKGRLSQPDLQHLIKVFDKKLNESEIRARITVPVESPAPVLSGTGKSTPLQNKFKTIEKLLSIVKRKSLYEFLDRALLREEDEVKKGTESSSITLLKDLSDKAEKAAKHHLQRHQSDPNDDQKKILASECQLIFQDKTKKDFYDDYFSQSKLKQLDARIKAAGVDGIQVEEFTDLLKAGDSLELDRDKVRQYIISYAQQEKWAVEIPTETPLDLRQRCSACGHYGPESAIRCQHCAFALQIQCPGCQKTNPSQNQKCTFCGFSLADLPGAYKALKAAEAYLQQDDLTEAEKQLLWVEQYWPSQPDLKSLRQRLQARQAQLNPILTALETSKQKKALYAQRDLFAQLKKMAPRHADLQGEPDVLQRIQETETWLTKGRQAQEKTDKIAAWQQALMICADCQEALNALQNYPPETPAWIKAQLQGDQVLLNWAAVANPTPIRYRLMRKEQGPPQNTQDGELLAETAQTQFTDGTLKNGLSAWYAVFSERQSVFSAQGCISEHVLLLQDVKLQSVMPGNGEVRFIWELPPGAIGVEVCRKVQTFPASNTDGEVLCGVGASGFTDAPLQNNLNQGYRITAIYQIQGKKLFSAGITAQATPVAPPEAVRELQFEKNQQDWILRWQTPVDSIVRLFWSTQKSPFHFGENFSADKAGLLGEEIPVTAQGQTRWQPSRPLPLFYLHVISVRAGLAVMGCSQEVSGLEDIRQLKIESAQNNLFLEWDWPDGCERVLVCWRTDTSPAGPEDSQAQSSVCTRQNYQHNQAWVFPRVSSDSYYFVLYSMHEVNGQKKYSTGVPQTFFKQGNIRLTYRIRRKKSFLALGKAGLELQLESDQSIQLPHMLLIGKEGSLPLNTGDGQILCEIPARTPLEKGKTVQISIPPSSFKNGYLRLFIADEQQARRFQLLMPAKEELSIR